MCREKYSLLEAQKILFEAQITADKKTDGNSFRELVCLEEGIVIDRSDSVAIATAFDYLDESDLGKRVIGRVDEYKRKWGKSFASIWNTGKVTSGFSGKALLSGIKTEQWIALR